MRHFFRRDVPPLTRVLLVESGSRHLFDTLIPKLYQIFGDTIEIDLVTCFAGVPQGFRGKVSRVTDYTEPATRAQFLKELKSRDYAAIGIICAAEPIMTKWKWWLAAKIPAKLFVVNENCDFFWADRGQWRVIIHFLFFRAGLTGAAAVPAIARLLFFPLTLSYLLLYAGVVHLRRKIYESYLH
ncbi:MAG TPA: hypothetical protein VK752_09445 [Bryobacteraceae bacterium]|nr:hypothetical protein [Bryobacteraceae bacterium]